MHLGGFIHFSQKVVGVTLIRVSFICLQKSRLEKQETGMTQHGVLFEESPIMYIAENTVPPHEVLVRLITRCGGQVRSRLFL